MLPNNHASAADQVKPSYRIVNFIESSTRRSNEVAQEEHLTDMAPGTAGAGEYQEVHPSGTYPVFNAQDGGNTPIQPDMQQPPASSSFYMHHYNMPTVQTAAPQMGYHPQMFAYQSMPGQMVYAAPQDANSSFTSSPGEPSIPGTPQMGTHVMPVQQGAHNFAGDPAMRNAIPDQRPNNLSISVHKSDLWEQFHSLDNEMILTRKGRKMFPNIMFRITGFESKERYRVGLTFQRVDDCRYKFSDTKWTSIGKGDPDIDMPTLWHKDDYGNGDTWNRNDLIKFDRVKLTNTAHKVSEGVICLRSMHKYTPQVCVIRVATDDEDSRPPHNRQHYIAAQFNLEVMEFIAVTAYNNEHLKTLKVDNNKYAKGFRADGKHMAKRHSTDSYGTPQAKMKRDSPSSSHATVPQQYIQPMQTMPGQFAAPMGYHFLHPQGVQMNNAGQLYAPAMQMAPAPSMYNYQYPFNVNQITGFQQMMPTAYNQQLASTQAHQAPGTWQPNLDVVQQEQQEGSDSDSHVELEEQGS